MTENTFPILPTSASISLFHGTVEGKPFAYALLSMQTPLGVQTYSLDRRQCLDLGSKLMDVARDKMPRDEGSDLTVVEKSGLIVPGTP